VRYTAEVTVNRMNWTLIADWGRSEIKRGQQPRLGFWKNCIVWYSIYV